MDGLTGGYARLILEEPCVIIQLTVNGITVKISELINFIILTSPPLLCLFTIYNTAFEAQQYDNVPFVTKEPKNQNTGCENAMRHIIVLL